MNKYLMSAAAVALLVGTANAADFSATAVYADPAVDWTGFYAGVFGAVGAGSSDLTLALGPGFGFSGSAAGGLAGVQIGADYQVGDFVVGAVSDIALSSISNDMDVNIGLPINMSSSLNYLGTVRARVGFLPTEKLLAYVHGGLAYGQTSPELDLGGGAGPDFDDVSRVGYTVGVGFEYLVTDNISVQTEYAYTNLGNASVGYTPVGGFPAGVDIKETYDFHTVKAGVNFRF